MKLFFLILFLPNLAWAHDPEMLARIGSGFTALVQMGLIILGGKMLGSKIYIRIWTAVIVSTLLVILFWGYDFDRYVPFLLLNIFYIVILMGVIIVRGIKILIKNK
jgi:hypothetical protein